jgi:hypothetical protein
VLDQHPRLTEGEVEAAEPVAGFAEESVERGKRAEFAERVEVDHRGAWAIREPADRHGEWLSRSRCRGEVDAEDDVAVATS